jgi:DNA-binding beta-propeller fold protein YncE
VAVRVNGGRLYVTDIYNDRVELFDTDGTFRMTWGMPGALAGAFNGPSAIAVSQRTGNVYVCEQGNNRVQIFDAKGNYLGGWGSPGTGKGQFNQPDGIAVNSSTGDVYVSEFGGDRIQRFNETGVYKGQWGSSGSGDGQFKGPIGLAVGTLGRVFVADSANGRVQVFDEDYLTQFGGSGAGQIKTPYGIAFGQNGITYVVDNGRSRVQRWQLTDPPVVTITGGTRRVTSLSRLTIRGTARHSTGSPSIRSVTATVNQRQYIALGTTAWKFIASLKHGVNKVSVVATDTSGATSAPASITVIRH